MTNPHQQIADLEAEIDTLSDAAEQCRKSMVLARVAAVAGVLLFGASLLGLIRPNPIVLVTSIAATLAGIGFFGSSRGSLEQLTEKIREAEARRAEMIDGMDLQPVQER
jgi:predicted benzoate:H+ symporter BenE